MQNAAPTGVILRGPLRTSGSLRSLALVLAAVLLGGYALEASKAATEQDEPAQRSTAASLYAAALGELEVG